MPRRLNFDREQVLQRAMVLFWERGYEAASVQALTTAMGINRFSMYNTFGDKQTLFLAALDYYADHNGSVILQPIEGEHPNLASIRAYFDQLLARFQTHPGSLGCLMAISGAERLNDPATVERVAAHRTRTQLAFERALRNAADSGELRADIYPRRRAAALTTFAQGLVLQARAGASTQTLRAAANAILDDLTP